MHAKASHLAHGFSLLGFREKSCIYVYVRGLEPAAGAAQLSVSGPITNGATGFSAWALKTGTTSPALSLLLLLHTPSLSLDRSILHGDLARHTHIHTYGHRTKRGSSKSLGFLGIHRCFLRVFGPLPRIEYPRFS